MGNTSREKAEEITDLLHAIQRGSSGAFVRLKEMYAPLIEREVARYRGSLSDADLEDLRQGALVSLYRAALSFREDRGVTFGLYAKICIVNGAADTLRYIGKRNNDLPVEDLLAAEGLESSETPQERLIARENMARVRGVLSELEYRIFLLYMDGFSYAEIGAQVDKSAKAVDNALCRIKQKLRKLFE